MARPKKYNIKLTDEEFYTVRTLICRKDISKMIRSRCQILLDLDEAHGEVLTHEQSARSNHVCLATVANTVTKYINGGTASVIQYKRNENSDRARRKVDCRAESLIIELASSPVPEGYTRWTNKLLEEKLKPILDVPVSSDAIRRVLKKANFSLKSRMSV